MTEISASRPPRKYSAKQFTEWRERWLGIDPDEALKTQPFGKTEEGLLDFRGLTIRKPGLGPFRQFRYAHFKSCDFTAASLAIVNVEHSIFRDCVFDYTDMDNFGDYGNTFVNCRFYRCEWQVGAIGFDLNTSKRGEYQSRYLNCHFENVRLTKTVIGDPYFVGCSFVFKKLSGVDFGCSGFVNCRFEGAFQDLTFRGKYSDESDTARKGDPQYAGFNNVSFEKAALQWFTLRKGFPFRAVKMPEDGSAFIADISRLRQDQQAIVERLTDPRSKEVIARYLDIECGVAKGQPIGILSRHDLFECFEKGEENLIPPAYDLLKQGYEIATLMSVESSNSTQNGIAPKIDQGPDKDAYNPWQLGAIEEDPNAQTPFRENQIDENVRRMVRGDPDLKDRVTGKPNQGPDFIDSVTGDIYGMATPERMQAQRDNHDPNLNLLDTSGETIEQLPQQLPLESKGLSGAVESAVKSGTQSMKSGMETGAQAVDEEIMPVVGDLSPP